MLKQVTLALTGASGAPYALRLLQFTELQLAVNQSLAAEGMGMRAELIQGIDEKLGKGLIPDADLAPLWAEGAYVPLVAEGSKSDYIAAFARAALSIFLPRQPGVS